MATQSQRKATRNHRKRAASRGLVRVEVQAPGRDAVLLKALAHVLRSDPRKARRVRKSLEAALNETKPGSLFDIFGSDLPDEVFDGVFDQPRDDVWRKLDL